MDKTERIRQLIETANGEEKEIEGDELADWIKQEI